MNDLSADSILQWTGVIVLLAFAIAYIVGWIRGRRSSCSSCELRDCCKKRNDKNNR